MNGKQTIDYGTNYDLLLRAAQGDEDATAELMERNTGLVRSIALRFHDRGVEYEDLLQIGSIGMLKAIRSFDLSRGTAFSTYAVPLIIGEIRRFLRDDGLIKVSRIYKKNGYDLMRAREKYLAEHGAEPHLNELAEMCSLSTEDALVALDASAPVHSLSAAVGGDESFTLEQTLTEEVSNIDRKIEHIALSQAISSLPPLWRQIVTLRYLKELSQQQTAEKLGLTQVRVSREEKKIFACLRKQLS